MATTLPDLTQYTDDEFAQMQAAMDVETARRTRLATIPDQVSQLALAYVDAGGQTATLTAAIGA